MHISFISNCFHRKTIGANRHTTTENVFVLGRPGEDSFSFESVKSELEIVNIVRALPCGLSRKYHLTFRNTRRVPLKHICRYIVQPIISMIPEEAASRNGCETDGDDTFFQSPVDEQNA